MDIEDWCYDNAVLIPSIAILAIIIVIGAIGNICACLVIVRTKSLHTHANYCLLSLACSDMLLLFLACPVQMYHFISCYASNNFVCKLYFYMKESCGFASIFTICAFTTERWLAVRHPLRMDVKLRNFCVTFASVSIFAMSIVVGLRAYDVSVEKGNTTENETSYKCGQEKSEFTKYTQLIIFIFSYIIPVIMLATMCFQIAASAHTTSRIARTGRSRRTPNKMNKLLAAIVVCFLVCWSPHQILQLILVFSFVNIEKSIKDPIITISACCYYLNCAVNPILYNMFSKNFRRALVQMIIAERPAATAEATSSTSVKSNKTLAVTVS